VLADDHAAAIAQLAERLPIDRDRVGVFGGSWGGYSAFRLAVDRPDVYRAAAAFAPGFDPYSSVLYECYLGLPLDNKAGYDFAQTLTRAPQLQGDLLLAGGTSDHATWTDAVKMSEALIRAGKQHEFVMLPEQYHGFDATHSAYFRTKLAAFFDRSLAVRRAQDDRPRYMGREHVARMNALLDGALRQECAAFDRDVHLHYEIGDDPERIGSWTVTVGPSGVRFALDEQPDDPAIVVRDTYAALAAAAAATRAGEDPGPDPEHDLRDPEAFALASAVIAAARAIATVDVRFPAREPASA
jgi:dienelactone hydrolase